MSFGARLAQERKRLGLKQAEFAALVGTDVPKQSLYENDRRELRADYLARLAKARVDVVYVLTGERIAGSWLGAGASDLLDAYLTLPADLQRALVDFVNGVRAQFDSGTRAARGPPLGQVHAPARETRVGDPD